MLNIHPTASISKLADIEESKKGTEITVGKNSVIDSFVKIKPAGGEGALIIGDNVYINSGCVFYTGHGIKIGDNVLIAANCTFAPTSHGYAKKDKLIKQQGFLKSKGGIVIEDDVWIGANVVLLDGTILRKGCVIGAAAVVNHEVAAYTVNVGNPLRQISSRK
jgi:acetyltransferase-like isoleucine patch superfamily enzyme